MKLSMEFTLLVCVLSLIFNLGLCSPSFIKSVVIQNLMCPSASIDFGHLRSGLQCAQKCYNDVDCQGFFYKPSGICLGSTFNISSPTGCLLETGTKYYYSTGKFLLNPLMTNGITHHYHLGESSFIFGDIKCDFLILFFD